jgi:hypothetical protein
MDERFAKVEQQMDERFGKVDERFTRIDERFAKTDQQIYALAGALRQEMHSMETGLRQETADRAEMLRDVINELGQRQAKVEGKMELLTDTITTNNKAIFDLVSRVARAEVLGPAVKRRKAG